MNDEDKIKIINDRTTEYEKRFEVSLEKLNIPKWLSLEKNNNLRKTKSEYIINSSNSSSINRKERNHSTTTTTTYNNYILQTSTTSLNYSNNNEIPFNNSKSNLANNTTTTTTTAALTTNKIIKSNQNWYKPKSLKLPENIIKMEELATTSNQRIQLVESSSFSSSNINPMTNNGI